jgi:RNA polymerase sigma-70 factor (ECF subfamily)
MTSPSHPSLALDADVLLAHRAWLSRIAGALVAKSDEIDDVVQQTFAQALAHPPRHATNVRAWLAAIARNVVRSDARSRKSREAREAGFPPPAAVEDPAEAVARAELQRRLVECVLALDEPHRSAVILRFFEEMDVAAIGRFTKAGEDTVRTRIRRGVLKLRERLEAQAVERAHSDDESAAALALLFTRLQRIAADGGGGAGAPSGSPSTPSARPSSGVRAPISSAMRRALLGVAAVTVVGGAWWWSRSASNPERPHPTDAATTTASRPESVPSPAAVSADRAREAPPTAPPAPAAPPAAPAAAKLEPGTIRGVVTSPAGSPVAGARVWALRCPQHVAEIALTEFSPLIKDELAIEAKGKSLIGWTGTTSGTDGRYEFTGLSTLAGWQIGAFEPTLGAMVSDVQSFSRDRPALAIDARLVRGTRIHGSVADEAGNPIGNALLRLICKHGDDQSDELFVAGARGEGLGRFDAGFRCGEPIRMECHAPGYLTSKQVDVEFDPPVDDVVMDFELKRRPGAIVRGHIVDRDGRPLDLLQLVAQKLPAVEAAMRPWKVTLWAIPAPDPAAPPVDGLARPKGSCEGRIDYVANLYEVVVPDSFRGVLELRIARGLVGSAALADPKLAVDLPCDPERVPKEGATTIFPIRFVDAESKLPIDLSHDAAPPQGNDGSHVQAEHTSNSDPEKGLIEYRCASGFLKLEVAITGYEHSLHFLDVPEEPPAKPLTIEVPRAATKLRGAVFHADGSPASKVQITIFRKDGDGMLNVSDGNIATNPDGEFEFGSVSKGDHFVVVAGSDDEAPAAVPIDIAPDAPPLEIRRVAAAPTRFRVVATPAPEQARTILVILDRNGLQLDAVESHATETQPSLSDFAFPLAPGHYTAHVEREGFRERDVPFDVPVGDEIVLKLEPAAGGGE